MITLAQILREHHDELLHQYGHRLRADHHAALRAMLACHTPDCGEVRYRCSDCQHHQCAYPSCGHRSCPACQHGTNNHWLDRQRQKRLPVDYFLVTFTLPVQLRGLAWHHPRAAFNALFAAARDTLNQFARNDPRLGNRIGLTGVLHTHSRCLDFHPHVHFVVPGGGLSGIHWQARTGHYLFNAKALAKVFRARYLAELRAQGLHLPAGVPKQWVAHCEHVGQGEAALTYLARYLYRGVISERNLVAYDGEQVTFRYQDGRTGQWHRITEPATVFLWRVLQHVLPKGFRRARDYGFLHGNARRILRRLQLLLRVTLPPPPTRERKRRLCPCCGHPMRCTLWRAPCRMPLAPARRRCPA